jgi:Tol biopolymer transport system component
MVLAAACSGGDAPPVSSWSIDSARVVFTASRGGNADIYLLVPGRTAPVRLTDHPAIDNFGRFAPDGRTFVFNLGGPAPSTSSWRVRTVPASSI